MARIDQFSLCLNILNIFGLYFLDLRRSASRCEKLLACYGYIYYFIKMGICSGIFLVISYRIKNELNFLNDYMIILSFWVIYFCSVFTFVFNYRQRRSESKIRSILKHVDNLLNFNLKNSKRSKKCRVFRNPIIIYLVLYTSILIKSFSDNSLIADPKIQIIASSVRFLTLHLHLTWIKFLLYGNIVAQRLDILLNCSDMSNVNSVIYQRVLIHLWMICKKINKVFGYQMIFFMCWSMSSTIFTGYIIADQTFKSIISQDPFISVIVSLFGITLITLNCQKCYDKV